MKYFGLSVEGLIMRFYLIMLIVIVSFATGYLWLSALALPIFLSGMLGVQFWPGHHPK